MMHTSLVGNQIPNTQSPVRHIGLTKSTLASEDVLKVGRGTLPDTVGLLIGIRWLKNVSLALLDFD